MDDAARATTDAMMRNATAATGEDNPDMKLRCECSKKKRTQQSVCKEMIRWSAQVPRLVGQDWLGHAATVRGEPPEPAVPFQCEGRGQNFDENLAE